MLLANYLIETLQTLPPFKGKTRLEKALLNYTACAKSHYGPYLKTRKGDYTYYASYFARYGMELVSLINRMPKDGIFIDFGANIGVFSLVASSHLSKGTVIAIEPNPYI